VKRDTKTSYKENKEILRNFLIGIMPIEMLFLCLKISLELCYYGKQWGILKLFHSTVPHTFKGVFILL